MARQSIFDMKLSKIYPLPVQKAERKGRTKREVDEVILWLTGYDMNDVEMELSFAEFFNHVPAMNPRAIFIKGSVWGG